MCLVRSNERDKNIVTSNTVYTTWRQGERKIRCHSQVLFMWNNRLWQGRCIETVFINIHEVCRLSINNVTHIKLWCADSGSLIHLCNNKVCLFICLISGCVKPTRSPNLLKLTFCKLCSILLSQPYATFTLA
jgi:hypothetical protein